MINHKAISGILCTILGALFNKGCSRAGKGVERGTRMILKTGLSFLEGNAKTFEALKKNRKKWQETVGKEILGGDNIMGLE